jgi:hypothetical protein
VYVCVCVCVCALKRSRGEQEQRKLVSSGSRTICFEVYVRYSEEGGGGGGRAGAWAGEVGA